MNRLLPLLLLLMLAPAVGRGQTDSGSLRIVFAGDIMGHGPQINAARLPGGGYDYEPSFRYVRDYIQSADLAIANLEVTLAGPPYTGYPQFSSPAALAAAASEAGFDILTTANNHCMDRGPAGLQRTLDSLDALGIPHLGTYRDSAGRRAEHPLMVDRCGIRLALLCYTYGTNGIEVHPPQVVNMIDTVAMLRDLQEARSRGADYVVTLIHWGIEYQTTANADQRQTARWLLDHGCSAVIGGHPHVVQDFTYDAIPGNGHYPEPVVYSMGNLVSNQRDVNCDGGIMVELELEKHDGRITAQRMAYMPYWVHRGTVDSLYQYYVVPSTDAVEHPDLYQIEPALLPALRRFSDNTRARLASEPLIPERRFYQAMEVER
ncbi:MAG: CapA family protein [Bacteroidales bacterium]|nr:CapA family protein [Bacteroidales bacterium]